MKKLLLSACILTLIALGFPGTSAANVKTRYVPFLGRRYPVSVLRQRVHTMDASFKDYGASGPQGARQTFGVDGTGVTIAIVDTGVDPNHVQLDDGKVIGFYDAVSGRTTPYDCHGHGTHVASIAAGNGGPTAQDEYYKGVAPGASILGVRVLDCDGRGWAEDIVEGIAWSVANGADIISMSLGGSGRNVVMEDAVKAAVDAGVVVVVAAGNSGSGLNTISTPGIAPEALTIGASSEWSGGKRQERSFGPYVAYFSSRGDWSTQTDNLKPDVVAPGVTVKAAAAGTGDKYITYSGTSMATPYVAGTAALMLQANPDLTPGDVKSLIHTSAFDAGPTGFDPDWGYGLTNTYSAVAEALSRPEKDIFPFHYFGVWSYGGVKQCSFGNYNACTLTIGGLSGSFGPSKPVTDKKQPIAIFMRTYTEGADLDMILVDVGKSNGEYPWFVTTASLPSGSLRQVEEIGVLPTSTTQWGYRLYVGPSMPFDDRSTSYSFGVDIFYR